MGDSDADNDDDVVDVFGNSKHYVCRYSVKVTDL